MPLTRKSERERKPHPPHEQEEAGPSAKCPRLEAAEFETTEPGRPHQAFVESEVRKYWHEMVNVGSLTKPAQDEIRTAALPILCQALRNRRGSRRHQAVDAMQLHAGERGWITQPYSRLSAYPGCIDALVQLADDADWLARAIPLPEHPPPRHPTIYYTIDPQSNRPVPREDGYIRGTYVYRRVTGHRVTPDHRIMPITIPEGEDEPDPLLLLTLGRISCFTLISGLENPEVEIHWLEWIGHCIIVRSKLLKDLFFSPTPPIMQWPGQE